MFLKSLIIHECNQKPIIDDNLGHVDESWFLMKRLIKHHQVFIWDETGFSSEIKHLHFLWVRYLLQYQRRNMSLHNFLKFQSRRHVKNSVFGTRGEALVIILDIFLENSEQWKIHFQPELSLQTYSIKRTRYQRFRLSETQATINKPLYWNEVLCTANDIPI